LKPAPTRPVRRKPGLRPPAERAALQRELGAWFRAERRALPWRETRDPFAIWISEAMLQQTRVETVIPYYRRFLERFPDVRSLAAAEESAVLAAWSGLGYYSRARSLRHAAQAMVERHDGAPPRTRAEWLALPGVGPYTAGAVLSIAHSESEALVDGNVQRVFARLFALEEPQGSPGLVARCWELARELVPGRGESLDPGEWNQALMELGARVCVRTPRCEACPLRARCAALARGRATELPRPRPRRAPLEVRLEILVARTRGRLLLVRRPPGGRMAGLHEFPTRERVAAGAAPRLWPLELPLALPLEPEAGAPIGELVHTITHHRIRATVRAARLGSARAALPEGAGWFGASELAELALSGLARKVLALAPPLPSSKSSKSSRSEARR
jgi:A/G-specific adenine glycosylase